MFRKTLLLILILTASVSFAANRGSVIQFLLSGVYTTQGPASGGKVYTYKAGTTTPKPLFIDVTLQNSYENPATLAYDGRLVAYGEGVYKFRITDANDITLFVVDNMEVESLQNIISEAKDPFGDTLIQSNLVAEDIVVDALEVTNSIKVGDNRIQQVASGTEPTDAVNLGQLLNHTPDLEPYLKKDFSNAPNPIAVGNKPIVEVATGTSLTDAVNLGQLNKALVDYVPDPPDLEPYLKKDLSNALKPFALSDSKITGVASGTNPTDAVNLSQLLSHTPDLEIYLKKDFSNIPGAVDLRNKRIYGLAGGAVDSEAVNLGQLNQRLRADFSNAPNPIALENKKINGLATGTADTDAANVGQMNLLFDKLVIPVVAPSSPQNGQIWLNVP